MKKIFTSSLVTLASLTMMSVLSVDQQIINGKPFDVTGRFLSGKLDARLIDVHTDKSYTPPKLHQEGHDSNVKALRKHSECATSPSTCNSQAKW